METVPIGIESVSTAYGTSSVSHGVYYSLIKLIILMMIQYDEQTSVLLLNSNIFHSLFANDYWPFLLVTNRCSKDLNIAAKIVQPNIS